MNKQDKLREIIQALLNKGKMQFTQTEIENTIVKTLYVADQRSIDNWFKLMFRLEYFTQPKIGTFVLFLPAIKDLDVKVDMKQESLDVNL